MRELPNDAPRELLLGHERRLATHGSIALRVDELQDQEPFVLEGSRAAIEHDLALGYSRRQLAKSECEAGRERALSKRDELAGRMHEVSDRVPDHPARARA